MPTLAQTVAAKPMPFGPANLFQMFTGIQVPDPITFVVGEQWCNRPNLYPRQATLLKVIFLRDDLFTDFDEQVIDEWEAEYARTGNHGIVPQIRFRIRWLKANGYKWFREVLLVMGRRAGKGHVTALAMAYVLWNYMAKGDPQKFYGVDRDKKLACLVFAGKRDQAKATVFGDLVNVILGAPCFGPFISSPQTEKLTVYAPHDFIRMRKQAQRGIVSQRDMATFEIMPKESTPMAGRGPTSFAHCLDPTTPVLTTDLRWIPIGEVQPGDRLIGVDEYPGDGQRKMRESVVEATWSTRKTALRITMEDGSSVVCSEDHRWLVRDMGKGGATHWRYARNLKVGNHIKHVVSPWVEDRSWEAGYLAGIYDGEGCVSGWRRRAGRSVFFTQKPGPTLDKTLGILRDKGFEPILATGVGGSRSAEQWALGSVAESMRFFGMVRPPRLMEKSRGVWDGVAHRGGITPSGRVRSPGHKTITSIEPLPDQELIDITTSTRTFIANGLVSHNCWDEMAHVVTGSVGRSVDEVYDAAKPSLDQFGKDAFIVEPSSPWQMMGKFYENYQEAIDLDEHGEPLRPNYLMVQLPSWDIYQDWERAYLLAMFPPGFAGDLGEYADLEVLPTFTPLRGAIQTYDEEMRREQRANPDTFAVERLAHWATALDAYLDEKKVTAIFAPWEQRPAKYGPPQITTQTQGLLIHTYKGHADPSKVNDKFGYALAHTEFDAEGRAHCVFDLLGHFDPADFEDHTIDYEYVDDWLWEHVVSKFYPEEFTFDQYNSTSSIQKFTKRVRHAGFPKRVSIFEKPATRPYDWTVKENSKAAINLGLVHAPYNERAELELRFLQLVNGRVDHPSSGPVQSKDIADAMTECIHVLIGEQVQNFLHADLQGLRPGMATMGAPFPEMNAGGLDREEDVMAALSGLGRSRGDLPSSLARGPRGMGRRPRRGY